MQIRIQLTGKCLTHLAIDDDYIDYIEESISSYQRRANDIPSMYTSAYIGSIVYTFLILKIYFGSIYFSMKYDSFFKITKTRKLNIRSVVF